MITPDTPREPVAASPRGGAAAGPPAAEGGAGEADAALVRRMGAGDERALGALYDRWSPTIQSLVQHILRDAGEAEDVVEETFWQAWRQAGRYESARGAVST